jgi:hypothetical protein
VLEWKGKAQLPKDSIVLTGEQKAQYDKFVALGKAPDDIQAALTEHSTLAERVSKADREATARQIAKLMQWNEDATVKVVDKEKLPVVMQTEKVDGRDVQVPYVKVGDAAPVRLTDYAKDHLDVYMPALTGGTGPGGTTDSARGTPYFEQETAAGKAPEQRGRDGVPALGLREQKIVPSQRK